MFFSTELGVQLKQRHSGHWLDQIDVLLMAFTVNQMLWKIGWWFESYKHMYSVRDRIKRTVIQALKGAGIVLPYEKGQLECGPRRTATFTIAN